MAQLLDDLIARVERLEGIVISLTGDATLATLADDTPNDTPALTLDDVRDAVLKAAERDVPKTMIKGVLVNYGDQGKLSTILTTHYPEVVRNLEALTP